MSRERERERTRWRGIKREGVENKRGQGEREGVGGREKE